MLTKDRSAADDLAQAACERALINATKFTPGTDLDRWVFTMARRIWLNDIRAAKIRQGTGVVALEEHDLADDNADTEMNILAREVFDIVQTLPEAQRLTTLLVYVEGYSYREAANMLEIPVGTVMSRLSVARKAIASRVDETRTES